MARNYLIPACTSNYGPRKGDSMKAKHYVRVFRLPPPPPKKKKKKTADIEVWIRALPYKDLNVNSNSVICIKHWPENYPTVKLRARQGKTSQSSFCMARCP